MHEELGRLDIQLFADIFADLDQVFTAFSAGTGFWFVTVFDARQMIGQGLATGARAFRAGYRFTRVRVLELFDFGFDGRQVGIQVSSNTSRCNGAKASLLVLKRMRL